MQKTFTTKPKYNLLLILILAFLFILIIYSISSPGKTPYDYFLRLSYALLNGKYYLEDNPPWLSELIPLESGRFTFVNPPMPAFLALPFVYLFGKDFPQQYLAHLVGAASVILTILISLKIKKDNKLALWSGTLIGLGSIVWFLSSVGSVWYLGQITAFMFLLAAILESLGKKRLFIIGIFLSLAFLSRLQILPSLVFFLFLIIGRLSTKSVAKLLIGTSVFVFVYSTYNYVRFGNIFETGYTLIPGILEEPWFNRGQFSLYYIGKHLKIFFLGLPKFKNEAPYLYPSWAGLAIWITSPAFLYSLRAPKKELGVKFAWLTILMITLINFSYGSTGFSQFGYRYAVDFYPFLTFLTIKGVVKTGLKWHHWVLLAIGIMVNLWGVLWINKFGWVSF